MAWAVSRTRQSGSTSMSQQDLERAAARKREAAGRTRCDGPGCETPLTGTQVRWCSPDCSSAYRRANSRGVMGQPRKHHVSVRDVFGHGVVVVADIRINGARACLLACDCGPDVLYAARVLDLVNGRVVSCGHCAFERRLEKAAQTAERAAACAARKMEAAGRAAVRAEDRARRAAVRAEDRARRAAVRAVAKHGFEVVTLEVRRR